MIKAEGVSVNGNSQEGQSSASLLALSCEKGAMVANLPENGMHKHDSRQSLRLK
jgi:hypothetical protein